VRPTYGLTDAEVERMVEESLTFAEEDVRARLLIDARNEAETVLRATDKALGQGADLIDDAEVERIRAAVTALRAASSQEEADVVRAATDRLNHETQHLAELLMDGALRAALQNRRVAAAFEKP
jgi:molecular chaperone DnaK (HSP70)